MPCTTYYTWYMASIQYAEKIYATKRKFFKYHELGDLFGIESSRTLEDVLRRLVTETIIQQLEKGKYLVTSKDPSDFEIAQFLYSPSYISFETALNYHGILSQFPIELTSATTKKRTTKTVSGKVYSYSKVSTKLYTGYYKEGESLIAKPEKALFDQLYMIAKAIKTEEYLDEMDYSKVDRKAVDKYLKLTTESFAKKIIALLEKHL